MGGPIITDALFSLIVIVLSIFRPTAGRMSLGIFFLAMGLGVNVAFLLTNPHFVAEYGANSWLPLYATLTRLVIAPNPKLFGLLLIGLEAMMGCCLLRKGVWVKTNLKLSAPAMPNSP